jgi:hypothetical protein
VCLAPQSTERISRSRNEWGFSSSPRLHPRERRSAMKAIVQHAAKVSNEACDRAMGAADKLSNLLRDAEDRCERAVSAAEKLLTNCAALTIASTNCRRNLGYAIIVPSGQRNG